MLCNVLGGADKYKVKKKEIKIELGNIISKRRKRKAEGA